MRALAAALLMALGGCASANVGGSAELGTGTSINLGAAIGANGIRPTGSISQKIF